MQCTFIQIGHVPWYSCRVSRASNDYDNVLQVVAGRGVSPDQRAAQHPGQATPSRRVPGPLLRLARLLLDPPGQVICITKIHSHLWKYCFIGNTTLKNMSRIVCK